MSSPAVISWDIVVGDDSDSEDGEVLLNCDCYQSWKIVIIRLHSELCIISLCSVCLCMYSLYVYVHMSVCNIVYMYLVCTHINFMLVF